MSEARRLKALEDENAKLDRRLTDAMLDDDAALRAWLGDIVAELSGLGYKRPHVLLYGDDHALNLKKTQRLYSRFFTRVVASGPWAYGH